MNRHLFTRASILALIGGAILVAVSATVTDAVRAQTPPSTLIDLRDAAMLREQFNRDRGVTRLVLLVSPT
jgi:hypothetical protein